eukprot:491960-Pelagomonas_calceolata.AAC.1
MTITTRSPLDNPKREPGDIARSEHRARAQVDYLLQMRPCCSTTCTLSSSTYLALHPQVMHHALETSWTRLMS